ncbi:hypothetical protein M9458_006597, partial [Cirrhinus mrigala]
PVSPGQPGWICSQNEEPEPFEEIQQDPSQRLGEQHPLIKPEKPEESVALPSKANNNDGSHMCADHSDTNPIEDEMTNCHFASKIKVEFMNSSFTEDAPDLPLGTSDIYRAQHPNQPTYTNSEAPATVSQHSSSSHDANH